MTLPNADKAKLQAIENKARLKKDECKRIIALIDRDIVSAIENGNYLVHFYPRDEFEYQLHHNTWENDIAPYYTSKGYKVKIALDDYGINISWS